MEAEILRRYEELRRSEEANNLQSGGKRVALRAQSIGAQAIGKQAVGTRSVGAQALGALAVGAFSGDRRTRGETATGGRFDRHKCAGHAG